MKEQSSQARPDHGNVCEKIEGDRPTETPWCFRYPLNGSPPSVRRVYDGHAASGTEGSLERFSKGRFLKVVFYASSTSNSTGALRRLLTLCASGHTRKVRGHLEEGVLFPELCRAHGRAEGLSLLSDLVTQPTQRGLQPEDWKGQRPNQPKSPREGANLAMDRQ